MQLVTVYYSAESIRAQPFGWVREQRDRSVARMLVDPFYSWTMIASE